MELTGPEQKTLLTAIAAAISILGRVECDTRTALSILVPLTDSGEGPIYSFDA